MDPLLEENLVKFSQAYSEPCLTSKMKRFVKTVHGQKLFSQNNPPQTLDKVLYTPLTSFTVEQDRRKVELFTFQAKNKYIVMVRI